MGKVFLAMLLSKGFSANCICIRTVCLFADALFDKKQGFKATDVRRATAKSVFHILGIRLLYLGRSIGPLKPPVNGETQKFVFSVSKPIISALLSLARR